LNKYLILILTHLPLMHFACSSEPSNDFVFSYGHKHVTNIFL
jgi:hypothetical protein